MSSRKMATVAIVAQVLVWIGTIGLTFLAVPELVPSYMTDSAGNRLTDSGGNLFISGFEKSSVEANHRYLWLAVFWIIPITIGMALQVAGPFKAFAVLAITGTKPLASRSIKGSMRMPKGFYCLRINL